MPCTCEVCYYYAKVLKCWKVVVGRGNVLDVYRRRVAKAAVEVDFTTSIFGQSVKLKPLQNLEYVI